MFRKVKRITKQISVDAYNACFNREYGYVMMLHRVGPIEQDRLKCIAELNVTEKLLQQFVDKHRNKYDFISLDEVVSRMKDSFRQSKPFISFTFDDGFRDNLIYGLPFFERNQIPFAVFVTVDYINRHPAFNYPFIIERIIRDNDALEIDNIHLNCVTIAEKNRAFAYLKNKVLSFPYQGFEDHFHRCFNAYLRPEYEEDLTLTWEEVRKLADSPLCTIGSHTMTHCRLSQVPVDSLRWELGESKRQLEMEIGKPVQYISYPFGWKTDVNETVLTVASELYCAGFQSYMGGVRKLDKNMMLINRRMLKEDE